MKNLPRVRLSGSETFEETILNKQGACEFNATKTAKSLGLLAVDYKNFSQIVHGINVKDPEYQKVATNAKSFVLKASDGEEIFVAMNAIVIIEKINTLPDDDDDSAASS